MNKKGISPLIGTVLLVAIVIAMILLIMPWVTDMIEKQKQRTTEASRQFDCITRLNFNLKMSGDKMMIDNRGDVTIEKIQFRIYDSEGNVETPDPYDEPIEPYAIASDIGVSCDEGIERIEAIATIRSEGRSITCADAAKDYYC